MLAIEKPILSKLLTPGKNRRIVNVDLHAGMVGTGLAPDCRQLANRAREEAFSHRENYACDIPGPVLVERVGLFLQAYTSYSSVRPFGTMAVLGLVDREGPQLYMLEPSGVYWGYRACAAGKGRQLAKTELEKVDFAGMAVGQAVKEAARIIHMAHDAAKDKDFELEMSWIGPATGNKHQLVPEALLAEAVAEAKQFILARMEYE